MSLDVQRVFPQAVHDSLAELKLIAKAAKSKHDPLLRKATADEIALAETQRLEWQCKAHSIRTGLPCAMSRIKGLNVCKRHGGATKHAIRKAQRTLTASVPTVLTSMLAAATQTENLNAAVKAGQDWLDRAKIGALVQAKVRASKREQSNSAQVVVNIGFLG